MSNSVAIVGSADGLASLEANATAGTVIIL